MGAMSSSLNGCNEAFRISCTSRGEKSLLSLGLRSWIKRRSSLSYCSISAQPKSIRLTICL